MSNKKEGQHYSAISWRPLPTDKTMKEFRSEYQQISGRSTRPSVTWLENTLKKLESEASQKIIHSDIFSARYNDDNDAYNKDHPTTKPRCIPLETQLLLFLTLSEKDKDKNIKGDAFAENVFSALADYYEPQKEKDLHYFSALLTLHHHRTQQALIQKFEIPLRQRLTLLYDRLFGKNTIPQIDQLAQVLEQMDYLLIHLPEPETAPATSTATQDLQALYNDLLLQRRQVINEKAQDNDDPDLYTWNSNVDAALIQRMSTQLKNISRSPKPEEVEAFYQNYNQYLLLNLDPEIQAQVKAFSEKYLQLTEYYFGSMDEAEFKQCVTDDLKKFSEYIFSELDKMENIEAFTDYRPQFASVAYFRKRLEDIQNEILNNLQEAIRLLRSTFAFFFFMHPIFEHPNQYRKAQDGSFYDLKRVEGVSRMMLVEINNLLTACQGAITPAQAGKTLDEQIFTACKSRASNIYFGETISEQQIKMTQSALTAAPLSSPHCLVALSILLRLTCKLFVSIECQKAEEILSEEYRQHKKKQKV